MKRLRFRNKCVGNLLLIVIPGIILFVTRSAYQSGDSLNYAVSVRTGGAEMFHPHHLIFSPVIRLLHSGLSFVFAAVGILTAGQLHNIAWAVATLISVYCLVLYLTHAKPLAVCAAALLFGTHGFFTLATWFEVYIPALGCLGLLTAVLVYARAGRLSHGRFVTLSGLLSLAVLYHQTNVLIVLPLGLYFALSPARRFREYLALVVSSGLTVLALYAVAYHVRPPNDTSAGFVGFCLRYVAHPNPTWGTWANVGTQGVKSLVDSQVWNVALLPPNVRVPVAAAIAIILGWNTLRAATTAEWRATRSFLILWICTYYAFFLWWLPSEHEFFLVTTFPLILLGTVTLRDLCALWPSRSSKALPTIVLASLSVFLVIQHLPVIRENHLRKGEAYDRARTLSAAVSEETLILTDYGTQQNLRFYFGRCRTEEMVISALCFFRGIPLPSSVASASSDVCLLDAREIAPNHDVYGRDGYSYPSDWLALIDWLFAFEYDVSGDVKSCREVEWGVRSASPGYIVIERTRQSAAGVKEVFNTLDQAIGSAGNDGDRPFAEWLRRMGPTMKSTIQDMARDGAIPPP